MNGPIHISLFIYVSINIHGGRGWRKRGKKKEKKKEERKEGKKKMMTAVVSLERPY